jgi:hypothetical protein
MKLVKVIITVGVLICLVVLLLPGLFTPWREALYDMPDVESRRQTDSLDAMRKGNMPDANCTIGDSVVITWLPRDFEKIAGGKERAFFKAFVSIDTPIRSIQTAKLDNVSMRLSVDEDWTELGACSAYKTSTNDCWVTRYHEMRLPKRFEPQEGTNAYVQIVVSATEKANEDDGERQFSKTFSYEFVPEIRSGRSKFLHWFTSL